jgi:hypothetical protein
MRFSNVPEKENEGLSFQDMLFSDNAENFIGVGEERPENNLDSKDDTWSIRWAVNRHTFQMPKTPVPNFLY